MRILYHHRTQGEEPESVHIASIVDALQALGHEVDVIGPVRLASRSARSGKSFLGGLKRRLPQAVVEALQILYNAKSFLQLAIALRRKSYAMIYERYALYNLAGIWASALFRLPLVLEVNTPYAQAWSRYYGLKFRRLARALERATFQRADRIITVTAVQRELITREGVAPERIVVCHNAIDPAVFSPGVYDSGKTRRELDLDTPGSLVVGFVGTMNRWQGVQGFVDVVRRVSAEVEDVRFLFVGDGEGRRSLMSDLDSLGLSGRARFVGRQPHSEVPRFIDAMDAGLLLDSNAYGSPMKVFEYWGMGKAVIAPRVPPVLEILEDGRTGILIDAGDSAAMAAGIVRMSRDRELLRRLGDAGRLHVLKHHVWTQNAQAIVEAYESGLQDVSQRREDAP